MKKNISGGIRLNLVLFLIVIALTFIAIQKPGINNHITYKKISGLTENQIQHIEIISSDQKIIQLTKANQKWTIETNENVKDINQDKISYLFNLLNTNSLENFPASAEKLSEYHLSNPRITVKFNDFSIAFGDSEPLKRRRYILIDGQIHLINDMYYHFLLQPAHTYLVETN